MLKTEEVARQTLPLYLWWQAQQAAVETVTMSVSWNDRLVQDTTSYFHDCSKVSYEHSNTTLTLDDCNVHRTFFFQSCSFPPWLYVSPPTYHWPHLLINARGIRQWRPAEQALPASFFRNPESRNTRSESRHTANDSGIGDQYPHRDTYGPSNLIILMITSMTVISTVTLMLV